MIRPKPVIWFELNGRQRFRNRLVKGNNLNIEVKWEKKKREKSNVILQKVYCQNNLIFL